MIALPPFPKKPADCSRKLLEACAELHAAGVPIKYQVLADVMGCPVEVAHSRVARLRRAGEFPYEVHRGESGHKRGSLSRRAAAAALEIEASGRPVTYEELVAMLGCTPNQAHSAVSTARCAGEWPSGIEMERPRRRRGISPEAAARVAARVASGGRDGFAAMDMDEADRIRAEWFAPMIDGRAERDDTPPGVAAVSGKDHRRWSEMSRRFENPAGAIGGEDRACKYHSPHARHYT